MRLGFKTGSVLAACLVLPVLALAGLEAADRAFPPPLERAGQVSVEVVDAEGALLRAFAAPEGRWRLKTTVDDVDPRFLAMLIAYEDRRFYDHSGVDFMALMRAALQLATNGRVVSGASTLSMQVARLIEPRGTRSLGAKLRQLARAVQIERRLGKRDILNLYLTHAPYGGNIEGVRAASLAYFGKEPRRLTIAEAALLVALPQSPERRRPDRHHAAALLARERVLARPAVADVTGEGEAERAAGEPVPTHRLALPAHAAHLAEAALRKDPAATRHRVTLRRPVQQALERVAQQAAQRLDPKVSLALMMADAATGEIIAEVGSAGFFDGSRSGWIDMTRVSRSPGSTLKPFIYGLGFEQGLVAQETIIEDRPANFFGYRPRNFDMHYQGDVSIREALQLSLNVPAVRLLDAVGVSRLMIRFRRAGVVPVLPQSEAPGLAIGLGGVGVTLKDMVQLYAALANRGRVVRLGNGVDSEAGAAGEGVLLEPGANWQVADILKDVQPPLGSRRLGIAYKTGTSYGYRDAWSIGFDGRHVLGVWIGRPDNGAVPGISGYATAAPVLFEAFSKAGVGIAPLPSAPPGALRLARSDLPAGQRRFSLTASGLIAASAREPAPLIVYPPEGARIDLGTRAPCVQTDAQKALYPFDGASDFPKTGSHFSVRCSSEGGMAPLVLKLQGGRAPFRWLANGRVLDLPARRRSGEWQPDGAGYSTLTVIDAMGRSASVRVFLE